MYLNHKLYNQMNFLLVQWLTRLLENLKANTVYGKPQNGENIYTVRNNGF